MAPRAAIQETALHRGQHKLGGVCLKGAPVTCKFVCLKAAAVWKEQDWSHDSNSSASLLAAWILEKHHEGAVGGQAAPAGRVCCSVAAGVTCQPCRGSCNQPGFCCSLLVCRNSCVGCCAPADCRRDTCKITGIGLGSCSGDEASDKAPRKCVFASTLRAAGPWLLLVCFSTGR